jgi:UDP-N-acetylmuramoyl-L-alanyl-D-glutamate--2,6-diaminopimelate ligase
MPKNLTDILSRVKTEKVIGTTNIKINNVCFDSRHITEGDLFVAVNGIHVDGHDFIGNAIQKGAIAVVCENIPDAIPNGIAFIAVAHSANALGFIASAFFGYPSEKMKVVGVTGTNGKTSTVFLLHQLFTVLGYKCGMLSTIENRVGSHKIVATHTTADALQINNNLMLMADEGCEYCFMEVSSHAIDQERIAGMNFYGGVFTNITHDHLDYHKTFDNYIRVKKNFFDSLSGSAFALVNFDDKNGKIMLQNTSARRVGYSIKNMSDFKGRIIESRLDGIELRIDGKDIWARLVGGFNAYNLLAAYSVAMLDGQGQAGVLRALSGLIPAEGRFQLIPNDAGVTAIVDYAHTPDALKNVLETIKSLMTGNEKLCTVVGAGGDRDKQKRPLMAQLACNVSDHIILTSDNPRTESPQSIIKDMEAGLDPVQKRKVVTIIDRKEAIKTACMISMPGDIILVAGKGHETYQEVNGVRNHFDDREVLEKCLNDRMLK